MIGRIFVNSLIATSAIAAVYFIFSNFTFGTSSSVIAQEFFEIRASNELTENHSFFETYLKLIGSIDLKIANVILFVGIVIGLVPIFLAFVDGRNLAQIEKIRTEFNSFKRDLHSEVSSIRNDTLRDVRGLTRAFALDAMDDEFKKAIEERASSLYTNLLIEQSRMRPVLFSFVNNEIQENETTDGLKKFVLFEWLLMGTVGGDDSSRLTSLDRISQEFVPLFGFSTAAEFKQFLDTVKYGGYDRKAEWRDLVKKTNNRLEQRLVLN